MVYPLLVLLLVSLLADAIEPSRETCDYYDVVEEHLPCGPRGYTMGFGKRLCERYLKAGPYLSEDIQRWFPEVRLCLQEVLHDKLEELSSCRELKKIALKSHIPCYLETGFCELSFRDKLNIVKVTSLDMLRPSVIRLGADALSACRVKSRAQASPSDGPGEASPSDNFSSPSE